MIEEKQALRARMRAARDTFVAGLEGSTFPVSPAKAGAQSVDDHDDRPVLSPEPSQLDPRLRRGRHLGLVPPQGFLDRLSPGLTVASYVPMGSEADPSPFARAARIRARKACFSSIMVDSIERRWRDRRGRLPVYPLTHGTSGGNHVLRARARAGTAT